MTAFARTERIRNASMPTLVATLALLLLALLMPAPSSARSANVRGLSASSTPQKSSLAVDMIHHDHFKSPFAQPNLTLPERMGIAAKSSRARLEFLSSKISGRRALLEKEEVFTSPVSADSNDGLYLFEISLGTPPRTLLVQADTGSVLTWVQCNDCLNSSCYQQPDSLFDPQASSTYNTIRCEDPVCTSSVVTLSCSTIDTCLYEIDYLDTSATLGNLANETLTLNGTDGFPQAFSNYTFGCGGNQSGSFGAIDGLVGLGVGNLSLISQLGNEIDNTFSYCLVNFYNAMNKTSPLLLGSVGNLSLTYTPILSNPGNPSNYYLDIIGITVNGVPLDYPNETFAIKSSGEGGMIIDSGTTFTYLFPGAFNPFIERLRSLINYPSVVNAEFDLCYNVSNVTNPVFPDVVMQFTDLDLALPADNLFLAADDLGTVCLFVISTGNGTISILGMVQQQNFQIGYDLTNNQIGFASTTC